MPDLVTGPGRWSAKLSPLIRAVPDYPTPGILFRDITPLLASPDHLGEMTLALADGLHRADVDLVTGIEARGFIVAVPVASWLHAGFIPVRKQGKLPRETVSASYSLEYAQATVELHRDAVRPGQRVLIVDDVLATGGTARAARALVEQLGGQVVGARFLIELPDLGGRAALPDLDVQTVMQF